MSNIFEAGNVTLSPINDGGGNSTILGSEEDDEHNPSIGVMVLALFALLINIVLFVPSYMVKRRRIRQQLERRQQLRHQSQQQAADAVFGGAAKNDRYHKIEGWVVSKQICAHDKLCEQVCQLRELLDTKPRLRKQTTSTVETVDTAEEEEEDDEEMATGGGAGAGSVDASEEEEEADDTMECPICFDGFQVGDVASWSADPACKHVFHHRCIKEWLLKSDGCPFCRKTFMPIDRFGGTRNFGNLADLLVSQENRSLHCFYCVDHGIVSLPRNLEARLEPDDWASLSARAQEVPDRSFLCQMRGLNEHDDEEMEEEAPISVNDQEVASNAPSSHSGEHDPSQRNDDASSVCPAHESSSP